MEKMFYMRKQLTLNPISKVNGNIHILGSKSISNRILLLSAQSVGETYIKNLLISDDVSYMLTALSKLGITFNLNKNNYMCTINGIGGALYANKNIKLFLGNSGTALRSLLAALCLQSQEIILTGDERMKERPIGHLVDALRQGGAKITYLNKEGYPPLKLNGGFVGGNIILHGNISSQFLTALLIMTPLAPKNSEIYIKDKLVSKPYVNMTIKLMKKFGISIEHDNYRVFYIKGNNCYRSPGDYLVEGDASNASYFLAAAAIKGGTVRVTGINRNSIQGDIDFANILEKMGAIIDWGNNYISCTRNELHSIDMDLNHIPDAAMTIATTALFVDNGTTTIRNIYNWRVKETDRLSAISTELRKIGANVIEGKDYISITPTKNIIQSDINTYNDHRMAMSFSLLALSNVPITILNPDCTNKTFPDYFNKFSSISIYK